MRIYSLIYLLINLISWKNILSLNIKKFKILLIISLLFFNFSNLKRINNELVRNDEYQYKNFPWFNEKNNTFLIREDLKISKNKYFTLIK